MNDIRYAATIAALPEALLNDGDKGVRWEAAHAVGHVRDAAAVTSLTEALNDEDAAVAKLYQR